MNNTCESVRDSWKIMLTFEQDMNMYRGGLSKRFIEKNWAWWNNEHNEMFLIFPNSHATLIGVLIVFLLMLSEY